MNSLHIERVGSGPSMVLLHGWAMHSGVWGELINRLAKDYQLHLVDLPGHGYTAPWAALDLTAIVDCFEDEFHGLSAPLSVLGWSLGATLAIEWSLAYPKTVTRLVLVGATPCFTSRANWPHAIAEPMLQRFGDELRVAYKQSLLRFLSLQVQGSESGKTALAELRLHLFERGRPSTEVLGQFLDIMTSTDHRPRVSAIKARARVIAGDRDMLTPLPAGVWLSERIPDADLRIIARAGHAPFLSHLDDFCAALNGDIHD